MLVLFSSHLHNRVEKKKKMASSSNSTNNDDLKIRATRLALYLHGANEKMNLHFGPLGHPCLGLHFGFGDKELERLQNTIKRHGRQDQFDNLTIPVDVLLRTLSFIPHHSDPRFATSTTLLPTTTSAASASASSTTTTCNNNTLQRLACISSTILYTIMENKCISGSSNSIPKSSVERARALEQTVKEKEKAEQEKQKLLRQQEIDRINEERQRDYSHHRSHGGNADDYEGLPPIEDLDRGIDDRLLDREILLSVMEELIPERCLLDSLDDTLDKKKKKPQKESSTIKKGMNLWGKKI